METETPKPAPILRNCMDASCQPDLAADKRTKAFYTIRRRIIWLGVLATLLAIITQLFFLDLEKQQGLMLILGIVVKFFFIATPILASILASFATKFYSNGAWLIYRAGSEEVKKEIYFFRTILQKEPTAGRIWKSGWVKSKDSYFAA